MAIALFAARTPRCSAASAAGVIDHVTPSAGPDRCPRSTRSRAAPPLETGGGTLADGGAPRRGGNRGGRRTSGSRRPHLGGVGVVGGAPSRSRDEICTHSRRLFR